MEWSFVEKGVILPHKLAAHRLRADSFHDHSGFQPKKKTKFLNTFMTAGIYIFSQQISAIKKILGLISIIDPIQD